MKTISVNDFKSSIYLKNNTLLVLLNQFNWRVNSFPFFNFTMNKHLIRILLSIALIFHTSWAQLNMLRRKRSSHYSSPRQNGRNDLTNSQERSLSSMEKGIDPEEDLLFFTRVLQTSMSFSLISAAPRKSIEFDIDKCESYSLQWLMDLTSTCDDYPATVDGCKCSSASELMSQGAFSCQSCPDKCSVCDTCLSLLKC